MDRVQKPSNSEYVIFNVLSKLRACAALQRLSHSPLTVKRLRSIFYLSEKIKLSLCLFN
jgi:uncharacterized protein YjaG (DUF416 family)